MNSRILAVANQKGGVGKTTTALSLGAALARMGKRILVMDLDPHACASVHQRYYPDSVEFTAYDLFTSPEESWMEVWQKIRYRQEGQLFDMVPASIRLSELEGDLRDRPGKGGILKLSLGLVSKEYDYVILDCPPHLGLLQINALVACDLLIIPIQTDFLALHGLKLLFDSIRLLNKVLPEPINYRALPTMYDKRAGACRRVLELLGKKMGDKMFKTVIGIDTRFRDASALGKVVYDIDPECRGAKGYELLANEIVMLL
ncbi:ParA family protein [Desulfovibrio mangrovi]|uniref:ParA family protein n=1 Tax=Desulfovibrio mangrovi TaxID=2976983 RepID=UPI002244FDBF|nr:ParA family protein [Desulfovibrio mangrovi]UZP68433.1 ParA family protein [Desulfovibrio mangrovi]